MNFNLLIENLTNPALLFFVLGVMAVILKSDLEIPPNSSKFISLYLLFSIGFKGGQELSHESFTTEIGWSMLFGIAIAELATTAGKSLMGSFTRVSRQDRISTLFTFAPSRSRTRSARRAG